MTDEEREVHLSSSPVDVGSNRSLIAWPLKEKKGKQLEQAPELEPDAALEYRDNVVRPSGAKVCEQSDGVQCPGRKFGLIGDTKVRSGRFWQM
jgi:hypothetical protein